MPILRKHYSKISNSMGFLWCWLFQILKALMTIKLNWTYQVHSIIFYYDSKIQTVTIRNNVLELKENNYIETIKFRSSPIRQTSIHPPWSIPIRCFQRFRHRQRKTDPSSSSSLLLFFLGIDSKLQKLPRSETTKSKSSSSLKEDKKVYFRLFEAEWTNKVECLKLQKMRYIQLSLE